jgi:hypothetical protein
LPMSRARSTPADARTAKTAQCAKPSETHIGNMRERGDNAVRRFSSVLVQGTSGTGH